MEDDIECYAAPRVDVRHSPWHTTPDGKQPFYFTHRDGAVMTITAIQDAWEAAVLPLNYTRISKT